MNTTLSKYYTLCLILTLCSSVVWANQNQDRPKVSQKPYEYMQQLSVLTGRWQTTTEYSPDGGQTWQTSPPAEVQVSYDQKDLMLVEKPLIKSTTSFNIMTFIAYDQYREEFRKSVIDDVWGIMDIYNGTITADRLIMTNLKAGTVFPISDTVSRGFKLIIELKPQQRKMIIESTDDEGKTWQPAYIISYKKIDPS